MRNLYLKIFTFFLLVNLLLSGGRLPSSDENAIFLLTQSIATRGALDVPTGIVKEGSTFNGKFYIWWEVGQPLLAVPLYWLAAGAVRVVAIPMQYQTLFLKAFVSLFNAFVGALIGVLVFAFARQLRYSAKTSLILAVAFCLGTFALPYFKSFLREPSLTLYLLGGCYFLMRWREERNVGKWPLLVGVCAGLGVLTKLVFAINVLLFLAYIVGVSAFSGNRPTHSLKSLSLMMMPVLACAILIAVYNFMRFGNVLEHGYKGATSFATPLYVGLFGLLLSPGKGVVFYAPIVIIGLTQYRRVSKKFPVDALLWLTIVSANVLLYAEYTAWGADGSWGPKYLLPVVPFLVLMAGEVLESGTRIVKTMTYFLIVLGICIQLGGTSVYFGTYLRELGEFPYTRSFDDPEFLYKSHFIPNYSPIIGHWKMAVPNIIDHLSGRVPSLRVEEGLESKRIPLSDASQVTLCKTLDYWFCYPYYVGYGSALFLFVPLLLIGLIIVLWFHLRKLVGTSAPYPV